MTVMGTMTIELFLFLSYFSSLHMQLLIIKECWVIRHGNWRNTKRHPMEKAGFSVFLTATGAARIELGVGVKNGIFLYTFPLIVDKSFGGDEQKPK